MSPLPGPQPGDVVLQGTVGDGFVLVDAEGQRVIANDLGSLPSAVETALRVATGDVWQQQVDYRGRPVGQPFRLASGKPDGEIRRSQ